MPMLFTMCTKRKCSAHVAMCDCSWMLYDIWCHINHLPNQNVFISFLWWHQKPRLCHFTVGLKCEILISLMLSKTAVSIMQFRKYQRKGLKADTETLCFERELTQMRVVRKFRSCRIFCFTFWHRKLARSIKITVGRYFKRIEAQIGCR